MNDLKVRRILPCTLYTVLCTVLLSGCVRVAGTAGYWKTGADGDATAKRASFDTADFMPGSPPPGDITV